MNSNETVKLLNNLLEYLNDSYKGYEECSQAVEDKKMAQLFKTLSAKRQRMANELAEKVRVFNEDPKEMGSITGAAHRLFVNLKSVITGGNIDSIINEIKRGENTMINRYKEVLREELPEDIHSILNDQFNEFEKDLKAIDQSSIECTN